MKIKCEYCGNYISDTDEKCPNCMAPNEHLKRVGNEVPTTIEELQIWYKEHNLPPEETTRFFIGKDIKEPRAFGVYKEESTGNFVVYKNKSTGDRAIRYEGKDEAYAVNELYLKLKEEIQNQKQINNLRQHTPQQPITYHYTPQKNKNILLRLLTNLGIVFLLIVIVPIIILIIGASVSYYPGYYESNNNLLYLYKNCSKKDNTNCEWYIYNQPSDEWTILLNKDIVVKPKYGGKTWNTSNRLYKKYNVTSQYYESDDYIDLHPPIPSKGYYNYNDQIYYYYYGWYIYNNGWEREYNPPEDVTHNPSSYYDSTTTSNDAYSFEDSDYYSSHSNYNDDDDDDYWSNDYDNDDWDSGSDWDSSDSWDSGSTDWDSDW